MAERRLVRDDERVLHDPGAERRADGVPEPPPPGLFPVEQLGAALGERREVEVERGRCDQDVRRLEPGQPAARVEDLLLELAERSRIELGVDRERLTGELEIRGELRAFIRAQNRKANVPLRRRRPAARCAAPDDTAREIPRTGLVRTDEQRSQQPPRLLVTVLADQGAHRRAHGSALGSCLLVQAHCPT